MSTVSYDGKKLIPAPQLSINKVYSKDATGKIIGKTYQITVTGTMLAFKGSPMTDRTFWTATGYPPDETVLNDARLGAILRKQEALRELFSEEGKSFEVQSLDGSQPLKFNPRINSIDIPEGVWYDQCPYSINMEADIIYPLDEDDNLDLIVDTVETWNIDTDDSPEGFGLPRLYRISHNVSATGKRFYNNEGNVTVEPWQIARNYVVERLGFDMTLMLSSGVRDLPSYYGQFNHIRTESIDKTGGNYGITETWILTSGTSIEDFSIEIQKGIEDGLTNVNVQGNITGLEQRDANMQLITSKYENASSRFTLASGLALSRAQVYSGYNLNILPVSETIGKNPITGTINYAFTYNDRPSRLIEGALSEVISLSENNIDTNTIAIIGVLGRGRGPVLQPIGTREALSRSLNIEVVFPKTNFGTGSVSEIRAAFFDQKPTVKVSGIIEAVNPANTGFSQVYITQNDENWQPINGRYSRNITWTYEQ